MGLLELLNQIHCFLVLGMVIREIRSCNSSLTAPLKVLMLCTSENNRTQYQQVVRQGRTVNLKKTSKAYILHLMQILEL